ncbi:GGDEF domain-containing protein [Hyphomicrobium sp. 1Nfss2.1]|uniref:GGDEF domain-containing protein n=1 Tax=Hyphomicrobium sp. 1Nfss2.1 TaxID=3413936 RepID=UPI003C7DDE6B
MLAIEFDLFSFANQLSTEERRITLLEAIGLTVVLGFCIFAFVVRRLREQSLDAERRAEVDAEIEELRDQAFRDVLTDLPNRRAVIARLKAIDPADGRSRAFFMMDLNGFKRVNDQYGHAAGDGVLRVIADRFKRASRPSDLLGRLGGDEFAVLADDVDEAGATALGNRYLDALRNDVWVEGVGHRVGVAIGAVLVPRDCRRAEDILANADAAMYRAKSFGTSALVLFGDPEQPDVHAHG